MKNTRDSLLGTAVTREIRSSGQTGHCPSPEDIAALVDGSMEGSDRDNLLGHLAECGKCRQIFFTARELIDEEPAAGERRRYVLPSLLASAAAIVIALTLTLTHGQPAMKTINVAKQEQATPHAELPPQGQHSSEAKEHSPPPQRSAAVSSEHRGRKRAGERDRASKPPLILLSAEEAAMPGYKSFGFANSPRQEGPAITVENMEIEDDKPFPLTVGFTPRDGNPVNITTLKLECLKSSPIDLTPRIRPHADMAGIKVDRVSLPSGSYRFRVSIGDVNGRLSEKEFTVNVSGSF